MVTPSLCQIQYNIHAFNRNGEELSLGDVPLVYMYLGFTGLGIALLVGFSIINVINWQYLSLIHIPLSVAFVFQIISWLARWWYYYEWQRTGLENDWAKAIRNLATVGSESYVLVVLLFVALGWRHVYQKFAWELKVLLLFLLGVFVFFALNQTVWVVPVNVSALFTGGYWMFKVLIQIAVLVSLMRSKIYLKNYSFSRELTHQEVYMTYQSYHVFFWCFAVYASLPAIFAMIFFALLYWYQLYIYSFLQEMNVAFLFAAIVFCFRAISYRNYKSVLDIRKRM